MVLVTGISAVSTVLFSWNVDHRQREFFFWLLLVVGGCYGVFLRDRKSVVCFRSDGSCPGHLRRKHRVVFMECRSSPARIFLLVAARCRWLLRRFPQRSEERRVLPI